MTKIDPTGTTAAQRLHFSFGVDSMPGMGDTAL